MQSMETQVSLFDEKLRVLVVDDDPVCSKIITRMLRHCNYQVTEAAKATEAMETLKNNPQSFDMVITDTRNDMDVLLLIVNIMKMENISVVLVSGLDDNSTLIQGVVQGADEIISKPVSLAKIKTLWQHVYRRRLKQNHNQSSSSSPSLEKEEVEEEETENEDESEQGKRKKTRVRWRGSLQEKFVDAVTKLGGPKEAMPKKIMELMNVPISRECVASHLQKYRKQKKTPLEQRLNSKSMAPRMVIHNNNNRYHLHQGGFRYTSMGRSSLMTMPAQQPGVMPPVPLQPTLVAPVTAQPCMGRSSLMTMPAQQPGVMPPVPLQPTLVAPVTAQPCYNYGRYEVEPQPSPASSMATDVNLTFSGDPWHDSEVLEMPPVPPQPTMVGPVTAQPCYNYGRYEVEPQPSPASSMATTDVNLTFSGDPWHDSEVLESAFFSGLQPEVDEWISEGLQTVGNEVEDGANYINYY